MGEQGAARGRAEPGAELVLAAVRRAVRQRVPAPGPAPLWLVRLHLAIRPGSRPARVLRRRLEELERAGLLARETSHGLAVWSPTRRGEAALACFLFAQMHPRLSSQATGMKALYYS